MNIAEEIVRDFIKIIELILKGIVLVSIYIIYALIIALMSILFFNFYTYLSAIASNYDAELILDGVNLDFITNNQIFNIALDTNWIYDSDVDLEVPECIFSMKINDFLIFELKTDIIESTTESDNYFTLEYLKSSLTSTEESSSISNSNVSNLRTAGDDIEDHEDTPYSYTTQYGATLVGGYYIGYDDDEDEHSGGGGPPSSKSKSKDRDKGDDTEIF